MSKSGWRERNSDYLKAKAAEWKKANPEKHREHSRNSYYKNREKRLQTVKEYSSKPEVKAAVKARQSLPEIRAKHYAANKNWREKHLHASSPVYKRFMLNNARKRAKKQGLEFSITVDDFTIPEVCPILGIELVVNKGKAKDNSPSLDRIDSAKGYIPGNVGVISNRANMTKSSHPLEVFEKIVEWIKRAKV